MKTKQPHLVPLSRQAVAILRELHKLTGRVYHDFPAENFNIDHIVIGSNGVFAVETKGRAKPVNGDVNVIFDGQGLQFPTHYEKDPFDQAKRQAVWLAKWLTSAVGA
jgi:integrase